MNPELIASSLVEIADYQPFIKLNPEQERWRATLKLAMGQIYLVSRGKRNPGDCHNFIVHIAIEALKKTVLPSIGELNLFAITSGTPNHSWLEIRPEAVGIVKRSSETLVLDFCGLDPQGTCDYPKYVPFFGSPELAPALHQQAYLNSMSVGVRDMRNPLEIHHFSNDGNYSSTMTLTNDERRELRDLGLFY